MPYTLTTLKAAVLEAGNNSGFEYLHGITDSKGFAKAVRAAYPDKNWNFRTKAAWIQMAEWLEVDFAPWQQQPQQGPKMADLKAQVLAHYEVANTKALKAKLDEWGIPFTNLRYKLSWQKLWDEVQDSQKVAAA